MKIDKILAGIDFGPDTEKVLAYASFLAKGLGASLNVLHVIDFLVTPPPYLAQYLEEEKKNAEKSFAVWNDKLDKEVSPVMEVVVGRLHESFEDAVRREGAGMLIISFKSHALRRSSSEKLIKGLEMPILVVTGEKAEAVKIGSLSIRKILCPVDFSEASRRALKAAVEIKNIFSSSLDVLHVLPSHVIKDKMPGGKERDGVSEELFVQAGKELAGFLEGTGIEKEVTIREGDPAKEIVSFSSKERIELIVLGARGRSLVKGPLIGSVTDAVLKSSPCPVLLIH